MRQRRLFDEELAKRHHLACEQEGLSCTIISKTPPPYMRWQMESRVSLGNPEINKELQKLKTEETTNVRETTLKTVTVQEFVDRKIMTGKSG